MSDLSSTFSPQWEDHEHPGRDAVRGEGEERADGAGRDGEADHGPDDGGAGGHPAADQVPQDRSFKR